MDITYTLCAFVLLTTMINGNSERDPVTFLEDVLSIYPSGWRIDWPSSKHRINYTNFGKYIPSNILLTRFQIYKNIAFVVAPRYRNGVPSTLNLLHLGGCKTSALLRPWPSLLANNDEDPNAIVNAVDLVLDDDTILWVLDIGEVNTLDSPSCSCTSSESCCDCTPMYEPVRVPPRIFGIDIFNGKLICKIELENYVKNCSRLQYLQVEKRNHDEKIIYITDAGSRSIIVLQIPQGEVYQLELPECIGGDLAHDILYIALAIEPELKSNILFITYLTSRRMYSLATCNLWKRDKTGQLMMVGIKPGPIVILGVDCDKRMFFRIRGDSYIFMWSICDDFCVDNFKLVKSTQCWRATDMSCGFRGMVWVLESNFQDFMRGNVGCIGASMRISPMVNASTTTRRQGGVGAEYEDSTTTIEIDDLFE